MAYGTAFGTTLSDLGRNLVASETTRNALQAALAAAAAQENIARTQAGSSRYATDAQRQATQLNAALRAMEDDRLRAATEREAGLRGQEITSREAMNRFQFAPNTPEQLEKERQKDIEVARIIAEAQKAQANRIDPRFAAEELNINFETAQIANALPAAEAAANLESEAMFKNRSRWWKWDAGELEEYKKSALAIPSNPNYAGVGKYLVPSVQPDGRILFKANFNLLPRKQTASVDPLGPPAPPTSAIPSATDLGAMIASGSAGALPASTEAPLSIPALANIVGGFNANAAPSNVTMLPTNRAAAMAATAFDPVLADALRKATARIQELVARGFSPQQAALKSMAEIPVAIRQRVMELQRGLVPTAP